jgi:hypothetical protein
MLRYPHLLLLGASGLNLALLFAPVAYASNFRTNIYAEVFGSWATVQSATQINSIDQFIHGHQDVFIAMYALACICSTIGLWFILFFKRGDAAKIKILPVATVLQVGQLGLGLLLVFHSRSLVGDAAPQYLEFGFHRELLFHGFILGFTLSARRRYRKAHALATLDSKKGTD